MQGQIQHRDAVENTVANIWKNSGPNNSLSTIFRRMMKKPITATKRPEIRKICGINIRIPTAALPEILVLSADPTMNRSLIGSGLSRRIGLRIAKQGTGEISRKDRAEALLVTGIAKMVMTTKDLLIDLSPIGPIRIRRKTPEGIGSQTRKGTGRAMDLSLDPPIRKASSISSISGISSLNRGDGI